MKSFKPKVVELDPYYTDLSIYAKRYACLYLEKEKKKNPNLTPEEQDEILIKAGTKAMNMPLKELMDLVNQMREELYGN